MYATSLGAPYYLFKSTLLNNYSAIHLVNSKDLLELGSFVPKKGSIVELGVSNIPIKDYGSRIIQGVIDGARGLSLIHI